MKKIITLITMIVLSVGFLSAQGYFTYQAVVVDADGNLVTNQAVSPTVTITDGNGLNEVQNLDPVQTTLNGLAILNIQAPEIIDWTTATIQVQFDAADVNIPVYDPEQVAAVPYALQAPNDGLTTEMIADYYGRSTTTMDDMYAILDALESNSMLSDGWRMALIDTVINNRPVAKQILLHYLNTGTPDDVQALFNAFNGNEELKGAFIEAIKELVQANREMVYDVLRQYALSLTGDEVNAVLNALPESVKDRIIVRAANYVKDPDHQSTLIIPVVMDYMQNITTDEFDALVAAIENNTPVFQVMLAQFNAWMDEYFETRYTGGNHVKDVVADAIEEGYYAQCDSEIDLCELKSNLESLAVCFELETSEFSFEVNETGEIVQSLGYHGTADPSSVVLDVTVGNNPVGDVPGAVSVNTEENVIVVTLNTDDLGFIPGEQIVVVLSITVGCLDEPAQAVGFYSED